MWSRSLASREPRPLVLFLVYIFKLVSICLGVGARSPRWILPSFLPSRFSIVRFIYPFSDSRFADLRPLCLMSPYRPRHRFSDEDFIWAAYHEEWYVCRFFLFHIFSCCVPRRFTSSKVWYAKFDPLLHKFCFVWYTRMTEGRRRHLSKNWSLLSRLRRQLRRLNTCPSLWRICAVAPRFKSLKVIN